VGDPAAGAAGHSVGADGFFAIEPMLYGSFKGVIINSEAHRRKNWLTNSTAGCHGCARFTSLPFLLALAGVVLPGSST
jgi:hypothetical protein